MKTPWQFGFLAIAIAGVSTYDFLFFKKQPQKQNPIQVISNQPAVDIPTPLLAPLPASESLSNTTEPAGAESIPAISREELQRLSQAAFISKNLPEEDYPISWPVRDPFAGYIEPDGPPLDIAVTHTKRELPVPLPKPAPQYSFSGTMIQGNYRLALVDGTPLSTGDRVGIWQLSRIEPDYIILEAGKETHRIELKGAGRHIASQKDPS
jgi:hypothetical protein